MDGLDLREHMDSEHVQDAFSKLVSGGRAGYKTPLVKDKPKKYCKVCGKILEGNEKFCPECGSKVEK